MDVIVHPVALAGWVGLFVTALNLFPVGQLDGGRIAYALFGRRTASSRSATFFALLALGAVAESLNWVVFAGLVFLLIGFHHAPPLDDVTPLSRAALRRRHLLPRPARPADSAGPDRASPRRSPGACPAAVPR